MTVVYTLRKANTFSKDLKIDREGAIHRQGIHSRVLHLFKLKY